MKVLVFPLIEHNGQRLPRNMRKLANEWYVETWWKTVEQMGEYRKGARQKDFAPTYLLITFSFHYHLTHHVSFYHLTCQD